MDHLRCPTLRLGHLERIEDERGAEVRRHRPADDAPAPRIQDDRQVEKPRPGRNVRDVGDPELIRAGRREVPRDEIRSGRAVRIATRSDRSLPATHARQAGRTHQTRDALAADGDPVDDEVLVNARDAVRPARPRVERPNASEQGRIGGRACGGRPRAPGIVPAGGDAQHAAQPADLMGGPMRSHELESFGGIEPAPERTRPPWAQPVNATLSAKTSAGERNPSVSRGR